MGPTGLYTVDCLHVSMYLYICMHIYINLCTCIYVSIYVSIYPTTVINEFCAVVTDVAIDLSCQSCL